MECKNDPAGYDAKTSRLLNFMIGAAIVIGVAAIVITIVQFMLAVPGESRSAKPLFTPSRMVPVAGLAFLAAFLIWLSKQNKSLSLKKSSSRSKTLLLWLGMAVYILLLMVFSMFIHVWWLTI